MVLVILTLCSARVSGTELTFELPDNEKQCFYEEFEEGVTFHIDYQVRYQLIHKKKEKRKVHIFAI